jgi:redox-sensitive bicupin YhaK (pirin superfamily)
METVTFILDGDILHLDNSGSKSIIHAGGVQWMSAGKGLIHSEISPDGFKQNGGGLEILQLWVNLPASHKMGPPSYKGLQKENIPVMDIDNGKSSIQVISGTHAGVEGPFQSVTGVQLKVVHIAVGGMLSLDIPKGHNIFFYVINGKLNVNNIVVEKMHLVEFENDHERVQITGSENSRLLLGHVVPLNEPVVSQGPFAMNTCKEIEQAYDDYQKGAFGTWPY